MDLARETSILLIAFRTAARASSPIAVLSNGLLNELVSSCTDSFCSVPSIRGCRSPLIEYSLLDGCLRSHFNP